MSAWLVSDAHIDALVQAVVTEGLVPMSEATATGKALLWENHLSLLARSRDELPAENADALPYVWRGIEAPLHDGIIAHSIACYEYQSCEHGEAWEASTARALMARLYDVLAARNDGPSYAERATGTKREAFEEVLARRERAFYVINGSRIAGYPWGLDSIEQAVKAA